MIVCPFSNDHGLRVANVAHVTDEVSGRVSRRALLVGAAALATAWVAGCDTDSGSVAASKQPTGRPPVLSPGSSPGFSHGSAGASSQSPSGNTSSSEPSSSEPSSSEPASSQPASSPPPSPTPVDPASVKANEVGLVPVMMFHRITPQVAGDFDTSPQDFRARLQQMFAAGYRPVRTVDLARGDLSVPAGYTPAVMTFDDGYPDQFAVDAAGNVDPQSGLGIFLDVCKQFPDCPPAGSFNINNNPFGLYDPAARQRGLARLHDLGFEIANHTFHHDNLSQLDAAVVQQDFVQLQQLVENAVPGASVVTMALPFGESPQNAALTRAGNWHGARYTFDGVLMVGASPAPSPFSVDFDPLHIPRIRNTSWHNGNIKYTASWWLDYLHAHPEKRYVSAGNPGHITVPKALAAKVKPAERGRVVTY